MHIRNSAKPAWPQPSQGSQMPGLTKREYFAAMAMQGMFAFSAPLGRLDYKDCAEAAVKFADALLEQLEQEQ